MVKRSILSVLGVTAALTACGAADVGGTPIEGAAGNPAGAPASTKPKSTCTPGGAPAPASLPKVDPATLPKCACDGGVARCVPAGVIPASFASQLASCDTGGPGLCVPDSLVASGGAAPAACKSLGDAEGVCLSVCVPQVAEFKSLLPQAGCAPDERCAPCLNPLKNNEPTGACDIGKASASTETCEETPGAPAEKTPPSAPVCPYEGPPLVDPAVFPSCGDKARCVPATTVPPALTALLAPCPTGLCAPESFVVAAGNTIPKTCTSVGGAEGRCTHVVIPQVAAQKDLLPQATCAAYERCAPCFDPLDGRETGACRVACDPGPKQPKTVFKGCCARTAGDAGRCVPSSLVPASLQKYLGTDEGTCAAGSELCAPVENIKPGFTPAACTGVSLGSFGGGIFTGRGIRYSGVCLSDCLQFSGIERLGVAQGSCGEESKCVPCINPLDGQPTGAPGCPAAAPR